MCLARAWEERKPEVRERLAWLPKTKWGREGLEEFDGLPLYITAPVVRASAPPPPAATMMQALPGDAPAAEVDRCCASRCDRPEPGPEARCSR